MLIPCRAAEPGPRVHEAGVPLGQRDRHPGAHQSSLPRSQHEGLGRDQVGTGVVVMGVRGSGQTLVEGDERDLHVPAMVAHAEVLGAGRSGPRRPPRPAGSVGGSRRSSTAPDRPGRPGSARPPSGRTAGAPGGRGRRPPDRSAPPSPPLPARGPPRRRRGRAPRGRPCSSVPSSWSRIAVPSSSTVTTAWAPTRAEHAGQRAEVEADRDQPAEAEQDRQQPPGRRRSDPLPVRHGHQPNRSLSGPPTPERRRGQR